MYLSYFVLYFIMDTSITRKIQVKMFLCIFWWAHTLHVYNGRRTTPHKSSLAVTSFFVSPDGTISRGRTKEAILRGVICRGRNKLGKLSTQKTARFTAKKLSV